MAALSLAIVGKDNAPIFTKDFVPPEDDCSWDEAYMLFGVEHNDSQPSSSTSSSASWKHQFGYQKALDRLEQWTIQPDGKKKLPHHKNFVGVLVPLEEKLVYGYLTNTHIKLLIMVEDTFEDSHNAAASIRKLLEELHELYVRDTMNPLSGDGVSTTLDRAIHRCVTNFNHRGIQQHSHSSTGTAEC